MWILGLKGLKKRASHASDGDRSRQKDVPLLQETPTEILEFLLRQSVLFSKQLFAIKVFTI